MKTAPAKLFAGGLFALSMTIFSCASRSLMVESSQKADRLELKKSCSSTKEYIASLNYLREKINLAGDEEHSRKIADQISQSCSGAARRFINTSQLLLEAELDNSTVIRVALEIAKSSDDNASAFYVIFQKVYLKTYLDLDAQSALNISLKLSTQFKGNSQASLYDFGHLVEFCLREQGLHFSQTQCADFATRIASLSVGSKNPVYPSFEKVFRFLMQQKNQRVTIPQAVEISERVLSNGAGAVDNFITAYCYALKQDGLRYSESQSLSFALRMAERSIDKTKTDSPQL